MSTATEKHRNPRKSYGTVTHGRAEAKDGDDGNTWSAEIAKAKMAEPYPAKETNCLVSTAEAKQRSALELRGMARQGNGEAQRAGQRNGIAKNC